ncbi:MAG: hypothetical protein EXR05_10245 [Acetobacteraceae bacterium]|nr:hypothetical protein [Acetobacteraceae bacterium]
MFTGHCHPEVTAALLAQIPRGTTAAPLDGWQLGEYLHRLLRLLEVRMGNPGREQLHNCIALGPSGTGKTHIVLALGLAACQKNHSVAFTTAAALMHKLMEARDERRLRALQKHLNTVKLLIVDELGYVPFTAAGSELLFEVFSQRYERGATLVTSNLPFDEWASVFGSERLTGALLDRLTYHVHILEMNGESFCLASSKKAQRRSAQGPNVTAKKPTEGDTITEG